MGESTDNRLKNLEERVEDIITTIHGMAGRLDRAGIQRGGQGGGGLPQMSYGYDMPPEEEYSTDIMEYKTPVVSDKPMKNRPGKVRDNTNYEIVNKYDISYKDKSILERIFLIKSRVEKN